MKPELIKAMDIALDAIWLDGYQEGFDEGRKAYVKGYNDGMQDMQETKTKKEMNKELWICEGCYEYYGNLEDGASCRVFDEPLPPGALWCGHYNGSKIHQIRCWWMRERMSKRALREIR